MNQRRKLNCDNKDFLLMCSRFDDAPFDWENINKNSRQTLIQMCIELKIPVGNATTSKKELIERLVNSPRCSQIHSAIAPDFARKRLDDFIFPTIPKQVNVAHAGPPKIAKRKPAPAKRNNYKSGHNSGYNQKISDGEDESDPSLDSYSMQPYENREKSCLQVVRRKFRKLFGKKKKSEILPKIQFFILWATFMSIFLYIYYKLFLTN